jgi:hypothetical protein
MSDISSEDSFKRNGESGTAWRILKLAIANRDASMSNSRVSSIMPFCQQSMCRVICWLYFLVHIPKVCKGSGSRVL